VWSFLEASLKVQRKHKNFVVPFSFQCFKIWGCSLKMKNMRRGAKDDGAANNKKGG
jgi:hypothetical protein